MLDWFSSKIAMIIAISILIISVVGFFNNENANLNQIELKNVADEISTAISNMANTKAETQLRVTFNKSANGTYMNPTVQGEAYCINLTQDLVVLRCKGFVITSKIASPIHLWNASISDSSKNFSSSEVQKYDSAHPSKQFLSGTDFVILNRLINIDGKDVYFTFVYLGNEN
ncbi:MAG: hypothetical protein WC974_08370 [Thermoplasmata archaeon]